MGDKAVSRPLQPPPPPPPPSTPTSTAAGRYSTLAPADASAQLAHLLATGGAQVTSRTDAGVSGVVTIKRRPSILLACFLALFFILPAVIYLVVGGKDESHPFNINIQSDGSGSRLMVSGHGPAHRAAKHAVQKLP